MKADPAARGKAALRDALLLFQLAAEKSSREGIGLTASALAFVSILSLVPLLAALLFIGASAFSEYQPKLLELLSELLPYSEEAISSRIQEFLEQARSLRGIGVVFFILSSLTAFTTVERAINRAWGLPRRRPFRQQLQSFTLLIFWGSLLLGAAFSVFFDVGRKLGLDWLGRGESFRLASPLILLAGLTMLYWLVPYTKVQFRYALLGGAVATFLLELLRSSFAIYANLVGGVQLVYGGFAFAFFFMVSIQIAWFLILGGNELTYVAQHFEALAMTRRSGPPPDRHWLGLTAVAVLAERLESGAPIASASELAARLKVSPQNLRAALTPLLKAGLVRDAGSGVEAFVLARAPRRLTLRSILSTYDPESLERHIGSARLPAGLHEIHDKVLDSRNEILDGLTVASLLDATRAREEAASEAKPPPEPPGEPMPTEEPPAR